MELCGESLAVSLAQMHTVSAGQLEVVMSHTKLSNYSVLLIECLSVHK